MKLPVTIWMNMPSFYQDDMFRVLAKRDDIDLQVVYARPLSADRLAIGWTSGEFAYPARILSGVAEAMRLAWRQRKRVHVVNGIWAEPKFAAALTVLAAARAKYAIYAEAPIPHMRRSRAKLALRNFFGRLIARRASGLLSISRFSTEAFAPLGIRADKIFPFGYFHSGPSFTTPLPAPAQAEFVYVGQLIERKNLATLLRALARLGRQGNNARLRVIGTGQFEGELRQLATELGIVERVNFVGKMSPAEVGNAIASATALVLPSRFDGWGLVANEALMAGVPVIVSTSCGASELIEAGENGFTFEWDDEVALANCLSQLLCCDQAELRRNAFATGQRITSSAVAPYLVDCLRAIASGTASDAEAPWRTAAKMQAQARSIG